MESFRNVLAPLQQQGTALGHFNVADLVLLRALSPAKALEAARAGFDSVVIVFSALPFEENVARTKETVAADNEDFRRAIAAGINIIHINTELRVAWRRSLQGSLASQPQEVVPYKILPPVVECVKQVVSSCLKLFNARRAVDEKFLFIQG
jgi:fructose/tagatose bisphosphate aldolase